MEIVRTPDADPLPRFQKFCDEEAKHRKLKDLTGLVQKNDEGEIGDAQPQVVPLDGAEIGEEEGRQIQMTAPDSSAAYVEKLGAWLWCLLCRK